MELDAGPSFNSVIDQAFLKAWRDARNASHGSPTLLIPKEKTFMLQPVLFRGRCKPPIVHIKDVLRRAKLRSELIVYLGQLLSNIDASRVFLLASVTAYLLCVYHLKKRNLSEAFIINYPKHYTKPPTMETQMTVREKSAYLDNPDALKKKKKKKTTFMPRREKRTLQNEAAEDQNQAQEEDTDAGLLEIILNS
ncbi:hypothetical protein JHK85_000847 [Glycine max]|nr:hypothetical protein JHK85_000847 [Glycine max]